MRDREREVTRARIEWLQNMLETEKTRSAIAAEWKQRAIQAEEAAEDYHTAWLESTGLISSPAPVLREVARLCAAAAALLDPLTEEALDPIRELFK